MPEHISSNQNPESLEVVGRVYNKEIDRRRQAGQDIGGAELIRDIAVFKARAQYLAGKRQTLLQKRRASGNENSFLLSGKYLECQDFEVLKGFLSGEDTILSLAMDKRLKKARYIVCHPICILCRFGLAHGFCRSGRVTHTWAKSTE